MAMRVMVNGREVRNPAVRALATMVVMAVVAFILALLMFVALPLLGVGVGTMLGLLAVGAGSLMVGVPLAIRRALTARRSETTSAGDLPARAWRDAEDAEYTIEDVPPRQGTGPENEPRDDG
jgi:hypothetical protein